jgi:hypothetical protein
MCLLNNDGVAAVVSDTTTKKDVAYRLLDHISGFIPTAREDGLFKLETSLHSAAANLQDFIRRQDSIVMPVSEFNTTATE